MRKNTSMLPSPSRCLRDKSSTVGGAGSRELRSSTEDPGCVTVPSMEMQYQRNHCGQQRIARLEGRIKGGQARESVIFLVPEPSLPELQVTLAADHREFSP